MPKMSASKVGFSLREFEYPNDYAEVIELWSQAGPGIHLGRSDQPEEIRKKMQRDPDLFLLAIESQKIIGTVLGGFDGRRGLVYHLAVRPEYRQQGIGLALMDELEKRLKAKGCIRCYLLVVADNDQAKRFYEAHGWQQMEILTYGKHLE